MNFQTQIARRVFPKDQTFMAKRKLRIILWAVVVGLTASAIYVGLALLTQQPL